MTAQARTARCRRRSAWPPASVLLHSNTACTGGQHHLTSATTDPAANTNTKLHSTQYATRLKPDGGIEEQRAQLGVGKLWNAPGNFAYQGIRQATRGTPASAVRSTPQRLAMPAA